MNANRCAEGLRVVEEIARFLTGRAELAREIKETRHGVRRAFEALTDGSRAFRDAEGDPGRRITTESENLRPSVAAVARANFARAGEALRVMEEFGKLLDVDAAAAFKQLRFSVYTLEKRLLGAGEAAPAFPAPPFLYAFVDRSRVSAEKTAETALLLVDGGAGVIQYRAKERTDDERRLDIARIIAAVNGRAPVVVNDDPSLALETGADGVHLGAGDPAPREARRLLGPGAIVGVTVHTREELAAADPADVDYVAVGAVYPTKTKPGVSPVGVEFVAEAVSLVSIPVVAIGGITPGNAGRVLDAGAAGLAVLSGILDGDVGKNCLSYMEIIGSCLLYTSPSPRD